LHNLAWIIFQIRTMRKLQSPQIRIKKDR